MIAWGPALRTAIKVAPVALEVARQVDRQLRPRLLAYRTARSVDGYVAPWTADKGTHWVVIPIPGAAVLRAFPPLPEEELALASEQLDAAALRHHTAMPEARARDAVSEVRQVPSRAVARLRSRGAGPGGPAPGIARGSDEPS